ncbi:exosortase/archaeosortase family protein [Thalassoglobus polymorphus]|uniref:Transmembrane exosortase (Exosortase_EpsH) n=1 Tax=Thalassoglobus polymorphus TaxID=2527994 RepID=A0A517QSL7_9PLAN|nr:exosortase/archaeosortase family protein [Thalassoglobus polymorphus]QDT34628.1 Transmembrane exosortase (Exosortase_EpsH) [Thalassoglobus polymorphus]
MTAFIEFFAPPAMKNLLIRLLILGIAGIWAFWSTIEVIATKWNTNPEYSHGYLVPLFSIALLWMRRDKLDIDKVRPNSWGLVILAGAILLRLISARYYMEWFDFVAIIPFVLGVFVLAGGWQTVRWAWPAILFLAFMLPLPYSLEVALRDPLRRIGTIASTYVMQTVGLPAIAEGNVIVVNDARIGVTEACSGMSMLMVFFAFSTAAALFIHDRPIWERLLVVASAIPIAIIANVTRITTTGLLYALGQAKLADMLFHDFAGWMMIPMALGILWLELLVASRIVIIEDDAPMSVGLAPGKS